MMLDFDEQALGNRLLQENEAAANPTQLIPSGDRLAQIFISVFIFVFLGGE